MYLNFAILTRISKNSYRTNYLALLASLFSKSKFTAMNKLSRTLLVKCLSWKLANLLNLVNVYRFISGGSLLSAIEPILISFRSAKLSLKNFFSSLWSWSSLTNLGTFQRSKSCCRHSIKISLVSSYHFAKTDFVLSKVSGGRMFSCL